MEHILAPLRAPLVCEVGGCAGCCWKKNTKSFGVKRSNHHGSSLPSLRGQVTAQDTKENFFSCDLMNKIHLLQFMSYHRKIIYSNCKCWGKSRKIRQQTGPHWTLVLWMGILDSQQITMAVLRSGCDIIPECPHRKWSRRVSLKTVNKQMRRAHESTFSQ